MRPIFLLLSAILLFGSPLAHAQEASPGTAGTVSDAVAAEDGGKAEPAPGAPAEPVDASVQAETTPPPGNGAPVATGLDSSPSEIAPPEPAPAPATEKDEKTTSTAAAPPVAVPSAEAAGVVSGESSGAAPDASVPPAVTPASAPVSRVADDESRAALLARINFMEQQLLAQMDREVNLYRDTIRLVTILGGAFAGLCMVGLLAAAFVNYRALIAVQGMYARLQPGSGAAPTTEALPIPGAGAVPGMERVHASGQRFQSRMSGLEQRLSELEDLAGRESSMHEQEGNGGPVPSATTMAEEAGLVAPPGRVIPRAMILVHKAQALANLGKLPEALSTLDEASTFDEAKPEVHLARGQVLEKLGRLADALKAYEAAVDVDDHNTSALLLKAGVLNRQERFSEALSCYERALEVHRAAV